MEVIAQSLVTVSQTLLEFGPRGLYGLALHGMLVFAFQDVAENRTSMAVRRIFLAGLDGVNAS